MSLVVGSVFVPVPVWMPTCLPAWLLAFLGEGLGLYGGGRWVNGGGKSLRGIFCLI